MTPAPPGHRAAMGRTVLDRQPRTATTRGSATREPHGAARVPAASRASSPGSTRAAPRTRSTRAAGPASVRAAATSPTRRPATRRGRAEPVSLGRLIGWGLAASVAFLVISVPLGGFGPLAFGALAGLWALGVAWIIIFGPPTFDRLVLHSYGRAARASLGDAGSATLRYLRSSSRSLGSSVRSARRPARLQRVRQSPRAATQPAARAATQPVTPER
ncbi:hypothetical protein ND748_21895, partial [Frankia sp. AiPs1]|nr:hypothetical protein [Frankia sp. AiPs1]